MTFIQKVSSDPLLTKASSNASSKLSGWHLDLFHNLDLYNKLKKFETLSKSNGAFDRLDPES